MLDLIIKNGKLVDGTGYSWRRADVGIKGERIKVIGMLDNATSAKVIDASGKIVAPGFIDMHGHTDFQIVEDPGNLPKLMQGVTTDVIGNCGKSPVPTNTECRDLLVKLHGSEFAKLCRWQTVSEYMSCLEDKGIGTNIALLVGHGSLRTAAMGYDNRIPSKSEMEHMKQMLAESMEAGAVGLSTGLTYPPGGYATTEELVELSSVIREYSGLYVSHTRSSTDRVKEAITETAVIGRDARIPVHISHFRVTGKQKVTLEEAIELCTQYRDQGIDLTYDLYPYVAGGGSLGAYLPLWASEGGTEALMARLRDPKARTDIKEDFARPGWDNVPKYVGLDKVYVTSVVTDKNRDCIGKNIAEIAKMRGSSIEDAYLDLILEEQGDVTQVSYFITDDIIATALAWKGAMVGSDGGGHIHPRLYGTFPRVIRRFVREKKALSLESAISKMTGLTAQTLGLRDRGLVREGMIADIVIFDEDSIEDTATFEQPDTYPEGIDHVILSGLVVVSGGEYTGKLAGRVVRP